MRLINTKTKRLVELVRPPPRYAILSHTWGEEEVSFHDMTVGRPKSKKGWPKFEGAVDLARKEGFNFIWIDNCCIDKSSSAELSEAINSMFQWYRQATVCYVYFSDVSADSEGTNIFVSTFDDDCKKQLQVSRWFRRSWTLQELLAPRQLQFYSHNWVQMGSKQDHRWQRELPGLTGISSHVLSTMDGYKSASVAQRMSWAAIRQATREEDVAYSLFGLFDVYMAPLYGEGGRNAFHRLQEEIIRKGLDDTILAWNPLIHDLVLTEDQQSGLAPSPSCFRDKGDVIYALTNRSFETDVMQVTPKGLMLDTPLLKMPWTRSVVAVLSGKLANAEIHALGIYLRPLRIHTDNEPWSEVFYTRDHTRDVVVVDPSALRGLYTKRIFIVPGDSILTTHQMQDPAARTMWICSLPAGFTIVSSHPPSLWNDGLQAFRHSRVSYGHARHRVLLLQDNNFAQPCYYVVIMAARSDHQSVTARVAFRSFSSRMEANDLVFNVRNDDPTIPKMQVGKASFPPALSDYASCTFSHYPDHTWSSSSAASSASLASGWPFVAKIRPEQKLGELGLGLVVHRHIELDGRPVDAHVEAPHTNWMDKLEALIENSARQDGTGGSH